MDRKEFRQFCYNRHDVVVNQKYGKAGMELPYSFHLSAVEAQAWRFQHVIFNSFSGSDVKNLHYFEKVLKGCAGHDLIEDTRLTYNDVKALVGEEVADIIYCCTEEKGRDRKERHPDKFYVELGKNELAVFVKLCDVMANSLFSLTTNSTMFDKMKNEYGRFYDFCYLSQHQEMWQYLSNIYQLKK